MSAIDKILHAMLVLVVTLNECRKRNLMRECKTRPVRKIIAIKNISLHFNLRNQKLLKLVSDQNK